MATFRVLKGATERSPLLLSGITTAKPSLKITTSRTLRFNNGDRRLVRRLASLVRIAEGLDHSHRQRINRIRAAFQRDAVGLQIEARGDASEDIRDANRSIELFEKEFRTRLYFRPQMG